jgi:hypothetical protein
MYTEHQLYLQRSLREAVAEQPPDERLLYLLDHLRLYLSRFIGFANHPGLCAIDLLGNDVYAIILIAIDIVRDELEIASFHDSMPRWTEFQRLVTEIDAATNADQLEAMRAEFDAARAELLSGAE